MAEEATEVSEAIDSTPEEGAISEAVESTEEVVETSGEEVAEEVAEAVEEQRFEIKVDGETLELTQAEVIELAQKGKSSVKRFQEAAKVRKEIESERAAIQAAMQGSPEELFKMKIQAGLMNETDMKRWVLEQALAISEEPELTEEQIKMKEMEAELSALKKNKEEEETSRKTAEFNSQVEEYKAEFSNQIISAIETGGLDNDPLTIQRVASLLDSAMDPQGNLQVTVQDAVDYVKQQDRNSYLDYVKGLDLESIEKVIGEDKLKQLKAKDLAKLKNPESVAVPGIPSDKPKSGRQKISAKDFFDSL